MIVIRIKNIIVLVQVRLRLLCYFFYFKLYAVQHYEIYMHELHLKFSCTARNEETAINI